MQDMIVIGVVNEEDPDGDFEPGHLGQDLPFATSSPSSAAPVAMQILKQMEEILREEEFSVVGAPSVGSTPWRSRPKAIPIPSGEGHIGRLL